jgi:hypothetical protein
VRHSGEGALCKIEGCLLSHSQARGASCSCVKASFILVQRTARSGGAKARPDQSLSPMDLEGKVETHLVGFSSGMVHGSSPRIKPMGDTVFTPPNKAIIRCSLVLRLFGLDCTISTMSFAQSYLTQTTWSRVTTSYPSGGYGHRTL